MEEHHTIASSSAGGGTAASATSPLLRLIGDIQRKLLGLLDPCSLQMLRSSCAQYRRKLLPTPIQQAVGPAFCSRAVAEGYIDLLRWARLRGVRWDSSVCRAAAHRGDLSMLRWLREQNGAPWDSHTANAAAANGHLALLDWLLRAGAPTDATLYTWAVRSGQLLVLIRVLELPPRVDINPVPSVTLAAETGRLDMLRMLTRYFGLDLGGQAAAPLDSAAFAAVRRGDLAILEWLVDDLRVPLTAQHVGTAAERGHLELLEWMRSREVTGNGSVCALAAGAGQLAVLRWLHQTGVPWDERTCAAAAASGQLAALRFAREHGCSWNTDVLRLAMKNRHRGLYSWAKQHGAPSDDRVLDAAASVGDLEQLLALIAEGVSWDSRLWLVAAGNGHLQVLQRLHLENCPRNDSDVWEAACAGNQLAVAEWLLAQNILWDARATASASWEGHLDLLRWLTDRGAPREKALIAARMPV
jgi:hypothetical protein